MTLVMQITAISAWYMHCHCIVYGSSCCVINARYAPVFVTTLKMCYPITDALGRVMSIRNKLQDGLTYPYLSSLNTVSTLQLPLSASTFMCTGTIIFHLYLNLADATFAHISGETPSTLFLLLAALLQGLFRIFCVATCSAFPLTGYIPFSREVLRTGRTSKLPSYTDLRFLGGPR